MEQSYEEYQKKQVYEALNVIQELGLCNFVKNFDSPETGFMWSSDPKVTQIGNALEFQGHSGCSFACTLRSVQAILKEREKNSNLPYPPSQEDKN
tara:strand:+ start:22 stop:306 length:285 start_codon:yes stop_codon:yes gene_type:complete